MHPILTVLLISLSLFILSHWGRDKMADILQGTFSNSLSFMEIVNFLLEHYWIYPHNTINKKAAFTQMMARHGTGDIWIKDGLFLRHIYPSLGLNVLNSCKWDAIIMGRPYRIAHRTTWWRHPMKTFFALLAICAETSPVTGEFPAQKPVTRSFDVFLSAPE